jgi:hypothetical protein
MLKYYFRLDYWIQSRYTNSFDFVKVPDLEAQKEMIKIFKKPDDVINDLTWFELMSTEEPEWFYDL